jgi:hypothetical protein
VATTLNSSPNGPVHAAVELVSPLTLCTSVSGPNPHCAKERGRTAKRGIFPIFFGSRRAFVSRSEDIQQFDLTVVQAEGEVLGVGRDG